MNTEGSAMRKAVLIMLLAVAGNCEAADWTDWFVHKNTWGEWVVVDQKETVTIYADIATIRNANDIATMWDLADFATDKGAAPVTGSMSLRTERQYDCNQQLMQILYISRHSGNMGEGKIVGSQFNTNGWQPVMLGTIGDRLWRIACGRR